MSWGPGGGSPSDSTFILEALLQHRYKGALIGLLWDPVAFQIAEEAGEDATLDMRIGGKCGPISGRPVDLRVTVRKLAYDCDQTFGPTKNGTGNLAWLQADGVDAAFVDHARDAQRVLAPVRAAAAVHVVRSDAEHIRTELRIERAPVSEAVRGPRHAPVCDAPCA